MPLPWILGGLAVTAIAAYAASDDSEEREELEREERRAIRRAEQKIERANEAAALNAKHMEAMRRQKKADHARVEKLKKSKALACLFIQKHYPNDYLELARKINCQSSSLLIKQEIRQITSTQHSDELGRVLLKIASPKSTLRLIKSAEMEIKNLKDST